MLDIFIGGANVTALVAAAGVSAWWVMPLAVFALLALSLRRAMRGVSRRG